jgi:hypothetical protein
MSQPTPSPSRPRRALRRLADLLGWTRSSYTLVGAFSALVLLIVVLWWPLTVDYVSQVDWGGDWWRYIDWLLLGIFAAMSLLVMAGADLKADALTAFVGLAGGLVIESWGTQTRLWTYYTLERPPLWILPAWPVATLAIMRIASLLGRATGRIERKWFVGAYGLMLAAFCPVMAVFIRHTFGEPLTVAALVLCALILFFPRDVRTAALIFLAGIGLGYFLELWGTTRLCWTYYTLEQPPLFAVMAHGMAALAFWRVEMLARMILRSVSGKGDRPPAPGTPVRVGGVRDAKLTDPSAS